MGLIVGSYIYTTHEGDTYDIIALDAYNDETKAGLVIKANPDHAAVIVFGAGVPLTIPIIKEEVTATLPPWKR